MQIANYRGTAAISGGIEALSRSVYSHSAVWWEDPARPGMGERWGAEAGGFMMDGTLGAGYARGTDVDLLEYKVPLTAAEDAAVLAAARSLKGVPYDFEGIAAFALHWGIDPGMNPGPGGIPRHVFCSAAVYLICQTLGPERVLVERTEAWKVAPEDVNRSALLKWVRSVTI